MHGGHTCIYRILLALVEDIMEPYEETLLSLWKNISQSNYRSRRRDWEVGDSPSENRESKSVAAAHGAVAEHEKDFDRIPSAQLIMRQQYDIGVVWNGGTGNNEAPFSVACTCGMAIFREEVMSKCVDEL